MYITKYYDFFEFRDEFASYMDDDYLAVNVMHDYFEEMSDDEEATYSVSEIRGIMRDAFTISEEECRRDYPLSEEYDSIEDFLQDNTTVYGVYDGEEHGDIYVVASF